MTPPNMNMRWEPYYDIYDTRYELQVVLVTHESGRLQCRLVINNWFFLHEILEEGVMHEEVDSSIFNLKSQIVNDFETNCEFAPMRFI